MARPQIEVSTTWKNLSLLTKQNTDIANIQAMIPPYTASPPALIFNI